MARIFVVANQKGGVGKTTTAVNLAAALAGLGRRTLLVDLDPQGNATMGSGIDKRALERSVYDVLIGLADVREAALASPSGGYSVLPANRELAGAELELEFVPAEVACRGCGAQSEIASRFSVACPRCQSADVSVVAGEEFLVTSVDVTGEG